MAIPRTSPGTVDDNPTLAKFKAEIGAVFCGVVNGVNGVISSGCGALKIERDSDGGIHLSRAAAALLTGIIQSRTDASEPLGCPICAANGWTDPDSCDHSKTERSGGVAQAVPTPQAMELAAAAIAREGFPRGQESARDYRLRLARAALSSTHGEDGK